MSQPQPTALAAPPATAPPPAAGAVQPGAQLAPSRPAAPKNDTPRLLQLLTTGLILVGIILGIAGLVSFSGMAYALDKAEANTAQLIRVQKIQTNLLSADATATNAFLVGGLEPPAQRAAYDAAITATGALIAEASEAQPADAAALSSLNQAVVDYAVTIEQARANNRQGFPVGSQYLRNASAGLRTDALPLLDNLVAANSTRASDAMDSRVGLIFEIIGLLALGALVLAMVWVARRFKRRLNTGLVAATALVLVAWVAGLITLTQVGSSVNEIQGGSFSSVNTAADVRIEANNAKSNESLTLIARGSGAAFEKAWAASAAKVDGGLARLPQENLTTSWQAYTTTHAQIRKLDDGGAWDAAVALATGAGANSSNAKFGAFDAAATSFLDDVSAETSAGLAAPQPLLIVFAVLTFLAGLGAALLARWGVGERLKEYR
ncbi:MAG: hypothetical protein ABWX96_21035 [Propionibacteriaceae bacterium]